MILYIKVKKKKQQDFFLNFCYNSSTMKLTILKIDKPVYMGEFEKVILPAVEGEVEILPGHVPFVSALKTGKIIYTVNGEKTELEIEKGFVEVNKVEVLVIL